MNDDTKGSDRQNPDPLPHYWICDICASCKGGIAPTWPVTCIRSTCPYCGIENNLAAVTDWEFPALGRKPIFD